MDNSFCPNCGMEVQPGEAFCGTCGFNLQQTAASAPPAAAAPPPPAAAAPPPPPPQAAPPQPPRAQAPPQQPAAPAPQQRPMPPTPAEAAQGKAKGKKEPKEPGEKKPGGFLKMDLKTMFGKGKAAGDEEAAPAGPPGRAAKQPKPAKEKKEKKAKPAGKKPAPAGDEGKKKVMLAVLAVVAIGAAAFFGYDAMFGKNPAPAPARTKRVARNTGTGTAARPAAGKPGAATKGLVTEEDLASMKAQRRGRFEDAIDLAAADFAFAGFAAPGADKAAAEKLDLAAVEETPEAPEDVETVEPGTLSADMTGADGSYESVSGAGTYDRPADTGSYDEAPAAPAPRKASRKSAPAQPAESAAPSSYAYIPPPPRKGAASSSAASGASDLRAYGTLPPPSGAGSPDLYSWKNKASSAMDARSLLAVRDEFNGPGRPSGPGGSFGNYTTFHKVLVSETTDYAKMERVREELSKRNLSPEVHRYDVAGDTYFEVTVGHYTTKDLAENIANEIRSKGYTPRIVTEKVYH